ncbi:MAG: RecQ family ATP-dependent DNA helicase, partial [Methylococcaceae bacterium]|nr:RecQ family ATP-dependent DNA helicase [Methylococcaceae bacterium]
MEKAQIIDNIASLDLESTKTNDIFAIAAVFQNRTFHKSNITPSTIKLVLRELNDFLSDAHYLLGHNLLEHDLEMCRLVDASLPFLQKPAIDTLLLSPLAFPENPYHRLVKNYKLVRDSLNNPLADAQLTLLLFSEQYAALQQNPALSFYAYCFSGNPLYAGTQQALMAMGAQALPIGQLFDNFKDLTDKQVCDSAFKNIVLHYLPNPQTRINLAYCVAWLSVSGSNSVLPPWVRLKFPDVPQILKQLRDTPCHQPSCRYCEQTHNADKQLQQFFGFSCFRPQPSTEHGNSLQQAIVQSAMADKSLLAILPTSGGKSLCFQLPALVRYQRRGVLTVVVSPLQALMKDQVDNLRHKTGAPNVAALYGLLTAPERGAVLNAVRLGDIAILYVSPEQLRNRSFKEAITAREIGCWVFDEAHCLSKWGHDFRPDYLYAARFIKEFAEHQKTALPPVQCFTATAKQDVKDEICNYFQAQLEQPLFLFEGGVERNNLEFSVQTVNAVDKYARIHALLLDRLSDEEGSAIIYCARRVQTEQIAEFLQQQQWSVAAFHAGKDAAEKKHIQENFIAGTIRIITATNAFGMGIDKDNVRLVIHADIPGSLENYLQEAGRAGRDQQDAECILLYDEQDIETQFKLSASSQVQQRDIEQILKGLRKNKKDADGNTVITTGELLRHDAVNTSFQQDDYGADTKVLTALAWLERAGFIERNENRTQVFQGRPLVNNLEEAEQKIKRLNLPQRQQQRWLAILRELMNAEDSDGFSADNLALLSEFSDDEHDKKSRQTASQRVIITLYDMAKEGLIEQSLLLTAHIGFKVRGHSGILLENVCRLENAFIALLRELAPDVVQEQPFSLALRPLNQQLLNNGHKTDTDKLRLLLVSLSQDGRGLAGKQGSLTLHYRGLDHYSVKLQRSWSQLQTTAELRQQVAKTVLNAIIARVPDNTPASGDVLVQFSSEDLLAAVRCDTTLLSLTDPLAAVERALNFLHEQKIITLQQGLAVFRSAMSIQVLLPDAKVHQYNKSHYEPLAQHYNERAFQIHVINEYAQIALEKIQHALNYVGFYFEQDKAAFVKRYFADRKEILERATSQQSFQRIIGTLNPEQSALVINQDDRNLLILAGAGSGKTRVVVHRCAYLLRVKRVPASAILVLCFNRNAVSELKRRLFDLVGDDAKGLLVQTYHGLSLHLTGRAVDYSHNDTVNFEEIIQQAVQLLKGENTVLGEEVELEADEVRDRLLAGYRYILVDEYQDIDEDQYQLITALTGRTRSDDNNKLTILAVGDDDQNIYAFRGANLRFIRQFQSDYTAREYYLVENYRSSGHIIAATNTLIQNNQERMKQHQPIRINTARKKQPAGGNWEQLDKIIRGRVQKLRCADESQQAVAVLEELQRLQRLDSTLDWTQCAVLAKKWQPLNAVRELLEQHAIPVSIALPKNKKIRLNRVREIAKILAAVKQQPPRSASDWLAYVAENYAEQPNNPWVSVLQNSLKLWQQETNDIEMPANMTVEFIYEILHELQSDCRLGQGVFLSTMHSAKGMEFAHVIILDGDWSKDEREEQRRLLYVAMTRAKETLCLLHGENVRHSFLHEINGDCVVERLATNTAIRTTPLHYALLGLEDLYLDYAARFVTDDPIHHALATLQTGDFLTIKNHQDKLVLCHSDIIVAQLSTKASSEWRDKLPRIQTVKIIALLQRTIDDSDEKYRARCKTDQWELPLV